MATPVIQSSPPSYSSAHDSLWFVISSGDSTQTNFKYVIDLLISGTIVASLKVFPDSGGYGLFDASPIIRNYFSGGFNASGSSLLQYAGSFLNVDYTISVGQEFGGTTYTGLVQENHKAWNYALDPFRKSISTYANKFLTSRDRTAGEVANGEKFIITYFNSTSASVTATIQKLNEDGSNNGSSSTGGVLSTQLGLILDLSPYAINSYLGSSFISDTTYAWRVTIGSDSIIVKQVCNPRFTPIQTIFQNQFGGYDSLTFRLISKQQKKVTRASYKVVEYVRSGTSMTYKNSSGVFYGGSQPFASSVDYSYSVKSNYLSAIDYDFGSQLIHSNEAYYYRVNGEANEFYPITIRDTTWEEKNLTADKLFTFDLTFDLGINQQNQYR
jgi:hypothetical protein